MHHSAEHLSPMVSSRNNPIGKFMEPFLGSWPLALCAVAPSYLFAINIGNLLYQFVVHIDTKCSWGWFGRWILVSPGAHRIHHSPMPEHFKKNLSILPLWDRLFGTWYDCAIINERVGLGEPIHNRAGMVKDCIADALEFGQRWRCLHSLWRKIWRNGRFRNDLCAPRRRREDYRQPDTARRIEMESGLAEPAGRVLRAHQRRRVTVDGHIHVGRVRRHVKDHDLPR
jgi:hypothetical protein